MQEFCNAVQNGFHIFLPGLADFVCGQLKLTYGNTWWNEVLNTVTYPQNLPSAGTDEDLEKSLDISNCLNIIDRKWKDLFGNYILTKSCRSYVKELSGVRNAIAHIGSNDIGQPMAERALDTMALLCHEFDPACEAEIRKIYQEVRAKAPGGATAPVYVGVQQPLGAATPTGLLDLTGTSDVQATTLTKRINFNGKTEVYPVYRVRLDRLYYNDQNDRIATWVKNYESENGGGSLDGINRDTYNLIIENFIYESNPDALKKTQTNISMIGQQLPGVSLADGRIIDGNRRFTCLRRIARETNTPQYFETIILNIDIQSDKKQIKQLELELQHGTEKPVDYDLIDLSVGTYRDIEQTKLLTVDEYAQCSKEPPAEVRKRIAIVKLINEFLEYIKLPEQYNIAREWQLYSLFLEIIPILNRLVAPGEKDVLKKIAFNNALLKAIPDQRKFIRDIGNLVKKNVYADYFREQSAIGKDIEAAINSVSINNRSDLDRLPNAGLLSDRLQISMADALQNYRMTELASKPLENGARCIDLLAGIDPRLFSTLNRDDRDAFRAELDQIEKLISLFKTNL